MNLSTWNFWSAIIVQAAASFTQFLLCIIYIYSSIKIYSQNHMEDFSIKTQLLHIITLLILFIQTVNWLFNYSGLYTKYLNFDCKYVFGSCYLLYLYYNGFLYCIYLQRLLFVYDNTKFQLHKTIKIILWCLIIIYFIVYTCIVYVEVFINDIVEEIHFANLGTICWSKPSSHYIFIGFVLMTVICSLTTLILFIRPLYKLFTETSSSIDNNDLLQVGSKYFVLTLLIIISTTCAGIGHTVLETPFIAGISVLINSVFIVLYEKRFVNYYNCICSTIVKKVDQISPYLSKQSISTDIQINTPKISKVNRVKSDSVLSVPPRNEMVKPTIKNKTSQKPTLQSNLSISLIK
eukprot:505563_1